MEEREACAVKTLFCKDAKSQVRAQKCFNQAKFPWFSLPISPVHLMSDTFQRTVFQIRGAELRSSRLQADLHAVFTTSGYESVTISSITVFDGSFFWGLNLCIYIYIFF